MKHSKLLLLLLLAQPALADEDSLTHCRQVEDIEKRVACYDAYVDSRYLSVEQLDEVSVTVTSVSVNASNKLTVTLENGQVWRQLDSKALRLANGDAVIIREASMGSYQLEKESGSRRIRVKRLN